MKKLLATLCLVFGIVSSSYAAAPDAGPAVASSVATVAAPTTVDASFWTQFANAALSKDWILLTGLALVALQYALRADWSPVTKWLPWFVDTTIGGWVFNFLVSFLGAFSLEVIGKHTLSWQLLLQTLLFVATSTGVYHGLKDSGGAKKQG